VFRELDCRGWSEAGQNAAAAMHGQNWTDFFCDFIIIDSAADSSFAPIFQGCRGDSGLDDVVQVIDVNAFEAPFVPEEFLGRAGTGRTVLQFRRNETIFAQGDEASAALYIQKGRVKLAVMSEQGKEAVVAILQSGQFFGEAGMIGRKLRIGSAIAMEDCTITAIAYPTLIATMHREPFLSEFFVTHLIRRNSRIEEDLIDQLFNSSEKRLARLLLLLSNIGDGDDARSLPIELSQETLAEMIGTTRSRVSHFMNKFRKLGFIDYNGHIEVYPTLRTAVAPDRPQLTPAQGDSAGL
jgi:CRP/FNR family transcriptional regulator, cyclic AMP receptor protein